MEVGQNVSLFVIIFNIRYYISYHHVEFDLHSAFSCIN
jgi:hypothetical protein